MALGDFIKRECSLGWVLVTYVGVFAALLFSVVEGNMNDQAIVDSGRTVIRNGCEFDNTRAKELRAILRRGQHARRALFKEGALPRQEYVKGRRLTAEAIKGITIRDCDREAMTLDDSS